MKAQFDVIIVGAGLVGMATALACAHHGLSCALIDAGDPSQKSADGRASTLSTTSVNMLQTLGVWARLAPNMQPITDMMIGDGTPGNISPLTLHLNASAARDIPMAHIGENPDISAALYDAVCNQTKITRYFEQSVTDAQTDGRSVANITLTGGTHLTARLCIAADGRGSRLRRRAGISANRTDYEQSAIVTRVKHERAHGGIAHQMFLPGGPFAILPLPGNRSSLVWTDRTSAIDAAMTLDEPRFMAELARRFGDIFGTLTLDSARQSYPLSLQMAEEYTLGRLALVGDAAHVIHPIAGQGLNLGFRDAAALSECLGAAKSAGLDPTSAALREYNRWRAFDNTGLAAATDTLNRLFSNSSLPLRHARRLGLALVDNMPIAQTFFTHEAAGELGDIPLLLRHS